MVLVSDALLGKVKLGYSCPAGLEKGLGVRHTDQGQKIGQVKLR